MPQPLSGMIRDQVHHYALRVFFEDTDLSAVVYHANYLRWFERARSDLLDLLGIDQRASFEAGEGAYVISDLSIRYAASARLGDTIMLETTAQNVSATSCRLVQRALRDATLIAQMTIRVVFVGPDGRPRRQPDAWVDAYRQFAKIAGPVPDRG
ncbi:YbgC/FadM family acyl-CoA thioesterase [Croceicoccus sp. F390]|uniref:YbgC/FadM family acyl-CoA thioesterase n=1 Tax=Croceicoccus esteveae TaxID=3075597 RepID=A0ABU2ZHN2_9SPHN|nr:YbgC/FadM family acyl-CoA thioesterase [Croceicoccus sp. F390]MDT0574922.1 YbgC/FadM family acyl-CoA thioesterase [Croceicoccus sp. F390]